MDHDKDGLLSLDEFMAETKNEDFEKDEDWKPLTEEDQYTEEEMNEYEKMLENGDHPSDPEGEHPEDHVEQEHEDTKPNDTLMDHVCSSYLTSTKVDTIR